MYFIMTSTFCESCWGKSQMVTKIIGHSRLFKSDTVPIGHTTALIEYISNWIQVETDIRLLRLGNLSCE